MFKKILFLFKKELMLSVSLAAAIASLFITPPSSRLLHDINWRTLATLFMLLSVLEGFKKENIFRPLLQRTGHLKTIRGLTTFFVFSVFFSSMFVTNDVSLIIFVPLTIILFRAGNKEKYTVPVLVLENIAAVRGSLLTPFGSPQNLFLFTQSGVTAPNFMFRMLPLWICSAILLLLFITFMYRKDLKERIIIEETEFSEAWKPEQKRTRILYLSLFVIIIATIVSRTRFDYVLLLTFLCFFVFSSSIAANPAISDFLKTHVANNEYWWSILLSQVVSNVPASIILWPFTKNLTALLYGLDSAGLVSIIGSLASVINYRLYAREYKGKALYFMKWFEIISLTFFAIIVIPQYFLAKI